MSSYGPMKRGAKHMTGAGTRPSPMGQAPRGGAAARAAVASSDAGKSGGAAAVNQFNPFAANKGSKKTTGGDSRTRAGQGFVFSQ